MRKGKLSVYIFCCVFICFAVSCSTQRKLYDIKKGETSPVSLKLGREESFVPQLDKTSHARRDTLKIVEDDGSEILIMKAIKDDETGEMVAADVIDAAIVTTTFRNVAERMGKVDIAFQVVVPESMMDSKWQLRFYPEMYMLDESVSLDPVIITGAGYRKAQQRGYQQYEKFLSKIINDSTRFINLNQLELFLERNLPEVYAFKSDSSYVSDEQFQTVFGVTQQQAVDHYTNKFAKHRNELRKARKGKMYDKYVKAPIVTEGIRLDTVIVNAQGDFVYNYVQTINTRPKLKKVDVVLSGDIYEQDVKLYSIPSGSPLTFYISSVAAFVDKTVRYKTRVIERKAMANAECRIEFDEGQSDIKLDLADNYSEIGSIKNTLSHLLDDDVFDLDSIVVRATASPEGSYNANRLLAQRRSESVSLYFTSYIKNYNDSLTREQGVVFNMDETWEQKHVQKKTLTFTPICIPENWDDLYSYVREDVVMTDEQKEAFFKVCEIEDDDKREEALRHEAYYKYLRESVYPRLRSVKFNFYLHRRGMTKDTVHTTVVDSTYMKGVKALCDMDYAQALPLLRPYKDYNAAIAYVGMDMNASAMDILQDMEKTAQVNYLLAILYSRQGDEEKAVECYVRSCRQNRMYVHRGNLDPEISVLIKLYGLNKDEEEPLEY